MLLRVEHISNWTLHIMNWTQHCDSFRDSIWHVIVLLCVVNATFVCAFVGGIMGLLWIEIFAFNFFKFCSSFGLFFSVDVLLLLRGAVLLIARERESIVSVCRSSRNILSRFGWWNKLGSQKSGGCLRVLANVALERQTDTWGYLHLFLSANVDIGTHMTKTWKNFDVGIAK